MSLHVSLQNQCRHCYRYDTLYTDNITHNLTEMADAAGLYKPLWRPDEMGITKAHQLIPILESGLKRLRRNPQKFRKYNPPNGWGTYESLVKFVANYLKACRRYPHDDVDVCR